MIGMKPRCTGDVLAAAHALLERARKARQRHELELQMVFEPPPNGADGKDTVDTGIEA